LQGRARQGRSLSVILWLCCILHVVLTAFCSAMGSAVVLARAGATTPARGVGARSWRAELARSWRGVGVELARAELARAAAGVVAPGSRSSPGSVTWRSCRDQSRDQREQGPEQQGSVISVSSERHQSGITTACSPTRPL
jgi:hypothetical protein